jgi:hypothetical protein
MRSFSTSLTINAMRQGSPWLHIQSVLDAIRMSGENMGVATLVGE